MSATTHPRLWWILGASVLLIAGFVWPGHLSGHGNEPSTTYTEPPIPGALLSPESVSSAGESAVDHLPAAQFVEVYVCGAVKKPGVYKLHSGARVIEGITKAGGALTDADLDQLNLAEVLTDATKVMVPRKGEVAQTAFSGSQSSSEESSKVAPSSHRHRGPHSSRTHKLQPGQWLNVNTATENELTSLPGVGPSLARRIIDYRQANGPFQTIDDLQNVSGIGPSKLDKMAPYIRL